VAVLVGASVVPVVVQADAAEKWMMNSIRAKVDKVALVGGDRADLADLQWEIQNKVER
jgi:hypothetical protein